MEAELPPSFRVVDVRLSDQILPSVREAVSLSVRDEEGAGALGEAIEESLLQMSSLGLPTGFGSSSRRPGSSRKSHRKSLSRHRLPPLISDDEVSESSCSARASVEGLVSISDDQASHVAAVKNGVSAPHSTDDHSHSGEAPAATCCTATLQARFCEPTANSITEMNVLLQLNAETAIVADNLVVASVEATVINVENAFCDPGNDFQNCVSVISSCGLDTESEGYDSANEGHKRPHVELGAVHNSGVCGVSGLNICYSLCDQDGQLQMDGSDKISNEGASSSEDSCVRSEGQPDLLQVDGSKALKDSSSSYEDGCVVSNVTTNSGSCGVCITNPVTNEQAVIKNDELQVVMRCDSESFEHLAARGPIWSACWDSHYNRYYFHNRDTGESTWEPPEGFEGYTLGSPEQSGDVANREANREETVFGVDRRLEQDASVTDVKSFSNNLPSGEAVSNCAVDGGAVDLSAEDSVVGQQADVLSRQSENIKPLAEEASSKESKSLTLENNPWSLCWDDHYSRNYYFNNETLESTWETPKDLVSHANDTSRILDTNDCKSETIVNKNDQAQSTGMNSSNIETSPEAEEIMSCIGMTIEGSKTHAEAPDCKVAVLTKSAKRFIKRFLASNCQNMEPEALKPIILKYWFQRFLLFKKYDLGIKLDYVGWFSVTPEAIAKHQAERCGKDSVIIDAFCGVGGNAIQFALAGHKVVAIDINAKRIELAYHNAKIYDVADLIDFVVGDFFTISSLIRADVVFLSPPWGGPDYLDAAVYDVLTMLQPKDGVTLLKAARAVAPNIILYVPRNVDINQLAELPKLSSFSCTSEVEKIFWNGKLKAITAYYGQFTSIFPESAVL